MMTRMRILICFLALMAMTALNGHAMAQMSNSPYSFGTRSSGGQPVTSDAPFMFTHRGAGDSVGMSPAYRQAILDAELNNNRPDTLVRDSNGYLVAVTRSHGQAFLQEVAQPFLVGGGGYGYSSGGTGFFVRFGGVAINVWTSMGNSDLGGLSLAAYAGADSPFLARTSPIDTWVSQLNLL